MNESRDKAAHLLKHYFRLVGQAADMKWNSDLDAEVDQIVDEIIDASMEKVLAFLAEKPKAKARK